ncbi:MAG: diguanylate cyclase [Gammaproteobacteria bacterium]|nr:diguanylate cyclase [Gammaproteobacteria bacterium]
MLETQQAKPAGTRVLVVDDSKVIRQAIKKMLNADFDVVTSEDGERGWQQLLHDGEIKALITDIDMPVLDGYAFICRIRASEDDRIRDLPIITITGAEDDETKARAYACGSTDFITKPLDAIQLKTRVRAYIRYDQHARVLEEKVDALADDAVNDPLTQLRSRRYFLQRGTQDISHCLRHNEDMSLLRLDIDDFKKIYKQHGDDAVDQLLVWFAKLLSQTVRTDDTVARIAGSAFAVLTPSTSRADALQLADRLRVTIAAQAFSHRENETVVTASIGLASVRADRRQNLEHLLKLAEERLIHARSEGGNRVCVSVLGDALAEPEEVVLAAAPETPAGGAAMGGVVPFDLVATGEVASAPLTAEAKPSAPTADADAEMIGIDRALQLLEQGRGERLQPFIESLMQRLQPLLAFHRASLGAKIQQPLKKKLSSGK